MTRLHRWAAVAAAAAVLASAALAAALYVVATRPSDIQESRAANVLEQCREQNARHDAAVHALDRLLADAAQDATPRRQARLDRSRAATVLLIAALAPRRDCVRRTQRLVGELPD